MSRPAAATQQKPEPRFRRARFAEEDLVSTFGEAMLAEARRLLCAGAVDLTTTGPAIEATLSPLQQCAHVRDRVGIAFQAVRILFGLQFNLQPDAVRIVEVEGLAIPPVR